MVTSYFTPDLAMGQIPRSTERIPSWRKERKFYVCEVLPSEYAARHFLPPNDNIRTSPGSLGSDGFPWRLTSLYKTDVDYDIKIFAIFQEYTSL